MPLPVLKIQPTMDFTQIGGIAGTSNLSVSRPNTPDGWFIFGDYTQPGLQSPLSPGYLVQVSDDDPNSPALAEPVGWTLITITSPPDIQTLSGFWAPIAPQNYVACGHVFATTNFGEKPVIPTLRCLNANLAKSYAPASLLYNDQGNPPRYACWSIAPLGTFFAWPLSGVTPPALAFVPTQPIMS
ncbi:Vps62-related protein [Bradyrhizobium prioriisuperbiae]|uniref:Vps62-related protein n=1 Tax=Bradyrhizobium prioriisuperbiae TaxID=2854389 RepID=UPI0028E7E6CD|nr:Vps62-related protein [Bradyrhizobium prioritasuperba]